MDSSLTNSINISQVSKFLNNYYQGVKTSPDKPSTATQLPQIESDELTPEVLASMQNYIVEKREKELIDNDNILNIVFLSGDNLEKLAKKFSNREISLEGKELILARFAMKFLFDKILDKNDTKMQEVISIISENTKLKEALSQVLAGVDDNNQAINRFNAIFNIVESKEEDSILETKEIKENNQRVECQNNAYGVLDHTSLSLREGSSWTPIVIDIQESQVVANKSADGVVRGFEQANNIQIDTDSIVQLQENRSKLGEVVLSAQEYNSSLFKISAVATKLDNELGLRTSDRSFRALSHLNYLRQINGLNGYYINNQLLGSLIFDHEEVAFYGEANQSAVDRAVEALEKEGMSKEEATKKVRELMEISLFMDWLLKVYEQVKSRKHEVDEIKYKADEQINLINQQITFLEARAQAKKSLKDTFYSLERSITDFFDKDKVMNAAKLMVEGMLFCQSQDYRNLLLISSMLDDKMMASFAKFKQELQQTNVNRNVIRAIDVVLTVHEKDMFNNLRTVKVA